jgi:hypothetical protein
MDIQESAYNEAKRLASEGEEYSYLVAQMNPHQAMMLKNYVLDLPEDLAFKTIYGRVAWTQRQNVPKGRGRPKKI